MHAIPFISSKTPTRIVVVGLGYVGLPLAIEFAKKYDVLGFDTDEERIKELILGIDRTHEADLRCLDKVVQSKFDNRSDSKIGLSFASSVEELENYNTYIVTVPTPINQYKAPDLMPLLRATEMLGRVLSKGNIIIYESTVYPGCIEEKCVPVLEKISSLQFNNDFFVGYSPERVNPGDKLRTLTRIVKVTSGSTPSVADWVDKLYSSIIEAGTYKASCIKVAEASKAIENAQRDVNISFVNELSLIFDRMGIDTNDVIEAAATKWNFVRYQPGLVGGHCIGVDPYYLAFKAQALGYHPEVILSGRRVNDRMGAFIASKVVKLMIKRNHKIRESRVLIMGITFKENCPDIRNTRVIDIYNEMIQFGLMVDIYDPWANADEVKKVYGLEIIDEVDKGAIYEAVILAVAHTQFLNFDYQWIKRNNGIVFDTKAFLDRNIVDGRL